MSFVAKAVKKVFKKVVKVVKRVVKSDWFKIAALVAITVFTAGVGSGLGFSAFSGAQGIGGFFSAVGQTMSAGWSAITSSVTGMFGAGSAAPAAGTQPLMTAGLEGTGGLLGTGAAAGTQAAAGTVATAGGFVGPVGVTSAGINAGTVGGFVSPLATNAGAQVAQKGILSKVGGLLMSDSVGGSMFRQGIIGGINYFSQKDAMEKAEGYYRGRNVYGGPAFGGSAEHNILFPDFEPGGGEQFAYQGGPQTPQEEQKNAQQQMQQAQQLQAAGPEQGQMAMAQQAAMQQPMPNQPPPQQRAQPPGLLQLENFGVA